MRKALSACGVQTSITDDAGRTMEKFGGHCLRVAGAQFLAAAGIQLSLIQLLGRWSSSAVERYVQSAPLSIVPQIPTEILRRQEDEPHRSTLGLSPAVVPAPSTPAPVLNFAAPSDRPPEGEHRFISDPADTRENRAQLAAHKRMLENLQADVNSIQKALLPPTDVLVLRPRSSVVHKSTCDEKLNPPQTWRTLCGWRYGCTRFFRVATVSDTQRVCKKCFDSQETQEPGVSDDSDNESSASESGSSSSDPST